MKKDIRREFTICSNAAIGRDTYLMRLCGDTEGLERPGQFVNVCLPDKYLRRPISVCDYTDGELLLMYKVVGEGTAEMERMKEGEKVQLLLPLGNGFDTSASGPKPLLLGGGIGVAPLYGLARQLVAEGKEPTVVVGFNTGEEAFWSNSEKSAVRRSRHSTEASLDIGLSRPWRAMSRTRCAHSDLKGAISMPAARCL